MSGFLAGMVAALWLALASAAQTTSAPPPPVAAPDPMLSQLERTADSTRLNLARLRIEKWKADSSSRKQSQTHLESLDRNLAQALPALVAQVRSSPDSLAASFKLYRNVNALYEVLATLAESAGAFGPREEYQALATDTSNLDAVRRALADRIESMTANRDAEITRLQNQIRQAAAAAKAAPPKKIVVDDNEPPKKPVRKKKPAAQAATQKPDQQSQKPQ